MHACMHACMHTDIYTYIHFIHIYLYLYIDNVSNCFKIYPVDWFFRASGHKSYPIATLALRTRWSRMHKSTHIINGATYDHRRDLKTSFI